MQISGKTKITGIFGYPVEHTLSPAMQNSAFQAMGIDYCYVPFSVQPENLGPAVNSIKALNMRGVNITVPHKEKVIQFLDKTDEEALFIGAVNTIVNNEGCLEGYNTDGRGFMKSLEENNINVRGSRILLVGSGGAARAVAYYLCKEAGSLTVCGRTKSKTDKLVEDLRKVSPKVYAKDFPENINKFNIIINATPLGLKENDPLPLNTGLVNKGQIICDLIYRQTPFIEEALKKGCTTLNGLGMLLWQGALAFRLWTGKEPPVDVMHKALLSAIH